LYCNKDDAESAANDVSHDGNDNAIDG